MVVSEEDREGAGDRGGLFRSFRSSITLLINRRRLLVTVDTEPSSLGVTWSRSSWSAKGVGLRCRRRSAKEAGGGMGVEGVEGADRGGLKDIPSLWEVERTNSWWPSSQSCWKVSSCFSAGGQTGLRSTRVCPRMGPSHVEHIRRLEGPDLFTDGDGEGMLRR